jgi:hypothetical protein
MPRHRAAKAIRLSVTKAQGKPCACARRLDKLPWGLRMSGTAWGARLSVRAGDADLASEIERVLPHGWVTSDDDETRARTYSLCRAASSTSMDVADGWALFRGYVPIARSPRFEDMMAALEADLQGAVAEHCRGWTFVHAAMVGFNNRAIVLPGASGAGKSTLTAALLRRGASYGSDEYAVFDDNGQIYPFPRRLDVGADYRTVEGPLPLGMVVAARYEVNGDWSFRTISPGNAVLELIHECPSAAHSSAETLSRLSPLARTVPAYRWARGEADEAADRLLRFAEERLGAR